MTEIILIRHGLSWKPQVWTDGELVCCSTYYATPELALEKALASLKELEAKKEGAK